MSTNDGLPAGADGDGVRVEPEPNNVAARRVDCPHCAAAVGQFCTGLPSGQSHMTRIAKIGHR